MKLSLINHYCSRQSAMSLMQRTKHVATTGAPPTTKLASENQKYATGQATSFSAKKLTATVNFRIESLAVDFYIHNRHERNTLVFKIFSVALSLASHLQGKVAHNGTESLSLVLIKNPLPFFHNFFF